jgi:hypothetical protein
LSRNGSGVYSLPAGTAAVTSETISSTKFNTLTEDLEADANEVRPIVAGGTGAASASAARTNLGLAPIEPLLTDPGADRITFWDDSESAFGYLTLGSGLSITTTVLSLDADLSTLAGLTVAADNFIAGNAGGTAWEVKTPAQARTSLGLANLATTTGSTFALTLLDDADAATALTTLGALPAASYTAADVLTKIKTVDGAGSGLDADTLDGVQASAFAALSGATFTGNVNFGNGTYSNEVAIHDAVTTTAQSTTSAVAAVVNTTTNTSSGTTLYPVLGLVRLGQGGVSNACLAEFCLSRYSASGTDANTQLDIQVRATNSTSRVTVMTAKGDQSVDFPGAVTAGSITAPLVQVASVTGTLTSTHANKILDLSGNITVPQSVFDEATIMIVSPGGVARTITRGAGISMYVNGTNVASATMSAWGTVGIRFRSTTQVVVTGDVA